MVFLLAAKPARHTALGLAGAVLNLLVEFVDLLESGVLGILCIRLGALELCLRLRNLCRLRFALAPSRVQRRPRITGEAEGRLQLTAESNLAPACLPKASASFSAWELLPGSSLLIFAEARWASAVLL